MPPTAVLQAMRGMQVETQARDLRDAVLQLVKHRNPDSAVVVMALADVIGLVGALQDVETGAPKSLDGRMGSLVQRIERTYARAFRDLHAKRQPT